jgi:broad specificity phosphatase PhoE
MKLYFVRHGESEANVLRIISNRGMVHGLTEKGRQQAAVLASELVDVQVRRIYSSPLLRAIQTAEILAHDLVAPVEISDALREPDCGIAEGRSDPTAWEMHDKVMREWLENKNWDARIEQGESFNDLRARFLPFLESITQDARDEDNLVLVIHGALCICMLPLVLRNIDSQFAMTQSRGRPTNARYVLAETTSHGLICRSWFGLDEKPPLDAEESIG